MPISGRGFTATMCDIVCIGVVTQLACADPPSGSAWPGTISDSAGIVIVVNERPPDDLVRWRTEPILRVGEVDGPDEYTFGGITDVAINGRDHLYVLDRLAQRGMVYDEAGLFRFAFGGPGEGPGELSGRLTSIVVDQHDSIVILDNSQSRLNVYAPDGRPARTIPVRFGRPGPYDLHRFDDGRFLMRWFTYNLNAEGQFVPWDALLLSSANQGSFDTVMVFDYRPPKLRVRERLLRPLITNVAFYDILADNRIIWSAVERDYLSVHALNGGRQRIIRNSGWRRNALDSEQEEALTSVYRARTDSRPGPLPDNLVFPDSVPTITAVRASPDGGFWVQRMGPLVDIDPEMLFLPAHAGWLGSAEWEIYDRDGRWYASVALPPRFRVTRVRASVVVGIERDELDVERVVVLRILR